MSTMNQPRKGGEPINPLSAFLLYQEMLSLMRENNLSGNHAGLISAVSDLSEIEGMLSPLEGKVLLDAYGSRPVLGENGNRGLVRQYLRDAGQRKGASVFNHNGVLVRDSQAIEGVFRGLDDPQYIKDNNARGATAAYLAHLCNGFVITLSKEHDRVTAWIGDNVFTTTQDIETVKGTVKGEVLDKDQFFGKLASPRFAYRAELPAIPNFNGVNFWEYDLIPERLRSLAIQRAQNFADKYPDQKLLIIVGDERLKDILTTPLDGNPVEDYYPDGAPNLKDSKLEEIMELFNLVAPHDGAIWVGLDGKVAGAKLFVEGARSNSIRFPDLRTMAAYSVSKKKCYRVLGVCVGNNGVQAYLNGRPAKLEQKVLQGAGAEIPQSAPLPSLYSLAGEYGLNPFR